MGQFSTLEIKGLDKPTSLTYDPWTKTHIIGDKGVTFAPPGQPPQHIASESDLENKDPNSSSKPFCPPESLRFVPNHKSQHLFISPSGLMIVSKQTNKSSENPIVYTNYGFTSGVHYWEIICPLSCNGLRLGVVKMENRKLTVEEMNTFRTTTCRVVGITLDLDKMTLQFQLNSNEKIGRSKTLSKGYWLPAIRITGIDNCVILNPYSTNEFTSIPYGCCDATKREFADWIILNGNAAWKGLRDTDVRDEIVLKNKDGNNEHILLRVKDTAAFIKDCEKVNIKPQRLDSMLKSLNQHPGPDSVIAKCLAAKEERLKSLIENTEGIKIDGKRIYEEDIEHCEYLPYTDKLLIAGKTSLKIIPRDEETKSAFSTGTGSLNSLRLCSPPQSESEIVKLYLTKLEAQQLSITPN